MSRGWTTAAIIFFFASCALGGLVMAQFHGTDLAQWKSPVDRPDAGR